MSVVRTAGRCYCDCHQNEHIKHVVPCCWTCPNCGANVAQPFVTEHQATCLADAVAVRCCAHGQFTVFNPCRQCNPFRR